MRDQIKQNGIKVNAIAGTHVVFLGLNIESRYKKNFRGFGIRRKDFQDGEVRWVRGMKTFRSSEPFPAYGETYSTLEHPWQGFQWADYSAKPGFTYSYTVVALYGKPGELQNRREATIVITTESELDGVHSVFFNRGSVATQEYARRFLNRPPNEVGPAAYQWLSRGLLEALIGFIDSATAGDSLFAAIYEFQWQEVLLAFKAASDRGVDVQVIYDDLEKTDNEGNPVGPWKLTRAAIRDAGIAGLCKGRKLGELMHNKFVVLSRAGQPAAVWTGSTNLTENGIFGHSNLGHIVNDATLAQNFMEYWTRLEADPRVDNTYRDQNVAASPIPTQFTAGTYTVFSPRRTDLDALNWYGEIAGKAKDALLMTFAFGMHENFKNVYRTPDTILRMALMDKPYASPSVKERDERDIQEIRNRSNVVVALGNRIVTNSFDRWLKEMWSVDNERKFVYWVHTKYMIVDPLGSAPVVISGSANFSEPSTKSNDENMLVIKGDKRICDIYFGEYMRLYTHYAFRESIKRALENQDAAEPEDWKPQYLDETDGWLIPYFDKTDKSARYLRRRYFSGALSL